MAAPTKKPSGYTAAFACLTPQRTRANIRTPLANGHASTRTGPVLRTHHETPAFVGSVPAPGFGTRYARQHATLTYRPKPEALSRSALCLTRPACPRHRHRDPHPASRRPRSGPEIPGDADAWAPPGLAQPCPGLTKVRERVAWLPPTPASRPAPCLTPRQCLALPRLKGRGGGKNGMSTPEEKCIEGPWIEAVPSPGRTPLVGPPDTRGRGLQPKQAPPGLALAGRRASCLPRHRHHDPRRASPCTNAPRCTSAAPAVRQRAPRYSAMRKPASPASPGLACPCPASPALARPRLPLPDPA